MREPPRGRICYTQNLKFLYKLHNSSIHPVCCYGQAVVQQQEKKSNQLYVSQYETQMQNKEASIHIITF